jgi:ribokinase
VEAQKIPAARSLRTAVVGHVEWVDFVEVDRVPSAGEIVHAHGAWQEPGGGGAVAAVQLAKLSKEALFFTALGDDELGHRAQTGLGAMGVLMMSSFRPTPQRRAITFVDSATERTITVLGDRLGPFASDPLPWDELAACDAVYLTAGDAGAVAQARRARVLVATSRALPLLADAGVELDAVVGSASDPAEAYEDGDIVPRPRLVVRTMGAAGGTWHLRGETVRTFPPSPLPGPPLDAYGCGDSFAAGLTYALGAGLPPEAAVDLAARCGASVLTGKGPFEAQLHAT